MFLSEVIHNDSLCVLMCAFLLSVPERAVSEPAVVIREGQVWHGIYTEVEKDGGQRQRKYFYIRVLQIKYLFTAFVPTACLLLIVLSR